MAKLKLMALMIDCRGPTENKPDMF